jgi:hypothetical protein
MEKSLTGQMFQLSVLSKNKRKEVEKEMEERGKEKVKSERERRGRDGPSNFPSK